MASLPGMNLDSLALTICVLWAVVIAQMDLITYRIANSSLALGLALVWPSLLLIDQRLQVSAWVLVFAVAALAAGLASLVGMGDVKLLLFLAPWLHYDNMRNPLALLVAISWLQLIAISLIQRRFPKRIAFAPAILLAAALNMAT